MKIKFAFVLFFQFLMTNPILAQVYAKNRDIVRMLCYLDGEIIFNPETSNTVEALNKIEPKSLSLTRKISAKDAVKVFGNQAKNGVFLMYSKTDSASKRKNQNIIRQYNKNYSLDKFLCYFEEYKNENILDCTHPMPSDLFPQFPGGVEALSQFISTNIQYPEVALQYQIMGTVVLGLIINEDGTIQDIKVVSGNDLGGGLKEEALRIGQKIERFYPASRKHIPIKSFYTLPIKFLIDTRSR